MIFMTGQSEVDKLLEDLRRDARFELLQKMLKPLLYGAVVAVLATVAWAFYNHHTQQQREANALAFEQNNNTATLTPPYSVLRAVQQARQSTDAAQAQKILQQAADNTADPTLKHVLFIKQAMLALSHAPAQVEALLSPIDDKSPLATDANELRFLAAMAQNNTADAQKFATTLLNQPSISAQRRERIAIMQQSIAPTEEKKP